MRPIWSGSIGFGLVNIPVKLYSGSEERALKFRLLDKKDHCPVSYKKVCRDDDKPVHQKDLVKGYEYEKGEYVILEPADFKRANAKKTEMIDIVAFANVDDIDSKYFDKPYFLEPSGKAKKAYVLLREALKRTKKVGIARYVLRDKEHIGAIKPDGEALVLDQLRYADELRSPEDLAIPGKVEFGKKELDLAVSLVNSLEEKFDISQYKDTYADELKKLIAAKAKGKLTKVKGKERAARPTPADDILAALKKSLDEDYAHKAAR
jgi:DNA end-binding protein Ku